MEYNWRGCKNITWEPHGIWADPDIIYNGYTFNYEDIENALWENFLEDTGHTDDEFGNEQVEREFDTYVQERAEWYLEDVIAGGYFEEGSTNWRDREES